MTWLNFLGLAWMLLLGGGVVLWGKLMAQGAFTRNQWVERTSALGQRSVDIYFLGKILLFMIAALGGVSLLIHVTRGWFPGPEDGAIIAGLLWQGGILYTGVCMLIYTLARKVEGGGQALFGVENRTLAKDAPLGLAAYAMSIPVSLVLGLLYFGVLYVLGVEMERQPVLDALLAMESFGWILVSFVFATVAAPVVEELLFRGLLLPFCLRTLGPWAGLLLSSLLFAFIHGHVQTLFPLFLVSVGFSLAYIWTGSIWVPIVMHGCFNFMNLLTGFIQHSGGPPNL